VGDILARGIPLLTATFLLAPILPVKAFIFSTAERVKFNRISILALADGVSIGGVAGVGLEVPEMSERIDRGRAAGVDGSVFDSCCTTGDAFEIDTEGRSFVDISKLLIATGGCDGRLFAAIRGGADCRVVILVDNTANSSR
jgi:hypothetical protein